MRLGMHLGSFSCSQGIRKPFCSAHALQPAKLSQGSVSKQQRVPALHAVATRVAGKSKPSKRVQEEEEEDSDSDEEYNDDEFEDLDSPDEPDVFSTQQLSSLLNTMCEGTEIAEVDIKMGSYSVSLRRQTVGGSYAVSSPAVASNGSATPGPAIEQPFQSTNSMDESQFLPSPSSNGNMSSSDEDDVDENLIYLGAPKVGLLRRHRYVKGKRVGKNPLIEQGAKVKKGQLLAFIEQLGTHVPIEAMKGRKIEITASPNSTMQAPQAGEVVWFGIDDGSAVEYKEVIIELAPFFGGHIIGDRKYA